MMDRTEWPLWLRQLELFYRHREKELWVSLSLDAAYELAALGLLRDDWEIDRSTIMMYGAFDVIRGVTYPKSDITIWTTGPVRLGEVIYSVGLEHLSRTTVFEDRDLVPNETKPRRTPTLLDKAGWYTEERELIHVPLFDSIEEEMFYATTRRPPPEYPGHFWHYSGWTYDRGRATADLCISMVSAATRRSESRQRAAAYEVAWKRKQAARARVEARRAEHQKELQAALWAEILKASEREALARGEHVEEEHEQELADP